MTEKRKVSERSKRSKGSKGSRDRRVARDPRVQRVARDPTNNEYCPESNYAVKGKGGKERKTIHFEIINILSSKLNVVR